MAKTKKVNDAIDDVNDAIDDVDEAAAQLAALSAASKTSDTPKSEEAKPEDGTEARPKTRICNPSDRAGPNEQRVKLRLDGHPSGARSQRYFLTAKDDAGVSEAITAYLDSEGIDASEVDGKAVKVVVVKLRD